MATNTHPVDVLSAGIASEDEVHHLAEINDSKVIEVSPRDHQFLKQLAARNQLEVDQIDDERVQVGSTGYAGVVALPDGKPIHIEPKLTGTALLRLLQYSGAADVDTLEQEASIETGTEYVDLLGTLFADELEQVRRRGISQSYRTITGSEEYIRGRLDIQRQLQRKGPAAIDFECTYDELTRDTPLNQTVLFATQTLVGAVSDRTLQRRLRRHVQELRRSVTLHPVMYEDAESIHLTRLNDHYSDILRLSKHVLQSAFIQDVAPGQTAGYTILLLMYERFEQAVENAVDAAATEYTVKTGSNTSLRGFLNGDFTISPEPDVLIENARGEAVLVLDAKWKELSRTGRLSPSRGDLYQILSYQQHTDTPGVLVYPGDTAGILGSAETNDGQQLWLASLPVAMKEDSLGPFSEYRDCLDTALTDVLEEVLEAS